jgi:hypothetical protein
VFSAPTDLPDDPATLQQGVEDLEQSVAEQEARLEAATSSPAEPQRAPKPAKRNRGALPAHLPRVEVVVDVEDQACPCCGAGLHRIGEDSAEMLDYVPAQLRVRVIRRPRYGCRVCEGAVVQALTPERPIDGRPAHRGSAGAAAGRQVQRPLAAVLTIADLRSSGCDTGSFDLMHLGRPGLLVAGSAARIDAEHLGVSARSRAVNETPDSSDLTQSVCQ